MRKCLCLEVIVFVLSVLLSANVQAGLLDPAVKVTRLAAPPQVVQNVDTVQIIPFQGNGGDIVTSDVKRALQNPRRSGGASSGVISGLVTAVGETVAGDMGTLAGQAVGDIADGVSQTGVVPDIEEDTSLRADVFEIVTDQADAKLTGEITADSNVESFKGKQPKRNSKGKVVKDAKGKTVYVTVPCKRRTVSAHVKWSLNDRQDQSLASGKISRKSTDSKCGDDMKNLASTDALLKKAISNLGTRIANAFTPFWTQAKIDFKRSRSIKEVIELHRKQQPQLAVCSARAVIAGDPYNVEGLLALGALHEGMGYIDEAIDYYEKSSSIDNHRLALKNLNSAQARKVELQTLADAYGLSEDKGAPDYSACPEIPEGRPMIVKRSTQLWSHRSPDKAKRLADLPRGMKIYVLKETPKWVQIHTPDGLKGWLPIKDVRRK